MKRRFGMSVAVATVALAFGMGALSASWADEVLKEKGNKKGQMEKEKKTGKGKKEPNAGGPMGESDTGGAGPSGPAPLPPGKAPGFEGAGKDKSRGPTAGGPQ